MRIVISGERAEGKTALAQVLEVFLKNKGYFVSRPNRPRIESTTIQSGAITQHYPRVIVIEEDNSNEETWSGKLGISPSSLEPLS